MSHYYTTLASVRREIKAENTVDDNYVLDSILIVSARIDEVLQGVTPINRPYFLPYKESREIELTIHNIQPVRNALIMPYPAFSFTAVGVNGTDLTANTRLFPPNAIPTNKIQLQSNTGFWWGSYCLPANGYNTNMATIAGVWGYNSDYANAWQTVDAIITAGINSSVTSFTVADADGVDTYGVTPRFSTGNYILIDSEIMLVTATNITTNALTVKRGQLGTTASAHLINAPIATYTVEDTIRRVVNRQVGAMYSRRGAYDSVTVELAGTITYPPDLLPELKNVLTSYAGAWG